MGLYQWYATRVPRLGVIKIEIEGQDPRHGIIVLLGQIKIEYVVGEATQYPGIPHPCQGTTIRLKISYP